MSIKETAFMGTWAGNLLLVCALNMGEFKHCLGVLVLYSAAYFLFVPIHAVVLLGGWIAYCLERAGTAGLDHLALRAAGRVMLAETLVFWMIYWGMVLEVVPLQIRL